MVKVGDFCGLKDFQGNEILPIRFEGIDVYYRSNMIKLKNGGKFGYFNSENYSFIECQFDEAKSFDLPQSNEAPEACVKKDGKWDVIDKAGHTLLPLIYDRVDIDSVNLYRVKIDGLVGIIDGANNILFPFKYRDLSKFNKKGIAAAQDRFGLYGYINNQDEKLIAFQFPLAENFEDGKDYAIVGMDCNHKGLIDTNGKIVVPMEFSEVRVILDCVIVMKLERSSWNHLYGVWDFVTGNNLPCKYAEIDPKDRNHDGILICECRETRGGTPLEVKVDSKND